MPECSSEGRRGLRKTGREEEPFPRNHLRYAAPRLVLCLPPIAEDEFPRIPKSLHPDTLELNHDLTSGVKNERASASGGCLLALQLRALVGVSRRLVGRKWRRVFFPPLF